MKAFINQARPKKTAPTPRSVIATARGYSIEHFYLYHCIPIFDDESYESVFKGLIGCSSTRLAEEGVLVITFVEDRVIRVHIPHRRNI